MIKDGDVTNLFVTRPSFAEEGTTAGSKVNAYTVCVLGVIVTDSSAPNP